jgi:sulfite exporter TauE/SafE
VTTLVLSVFVAALLGSVHCAAMCGSFACLASGGDATSGSRATRSTIAYNLGRLGSYMSLGLIAGTAGAGLDRAGAVAGFARPATVVAGVLLILWGSTTLLASLGVRLPVLAVPPSLASRVAGALRAVQSRPPMVRGLAIGALSAALPCGWLYAFVATSSASGSGVGGALVMSAFWVGTLPMMVAIGLGAQRLLGPMRQRLPVLTATVLVVLGTLTVTGRLIAPAAHATAHPAAAPAAVTPMGVAHDSHR